MVTVSIGPTIEFNERSGMASSTRRKAVELWGPRLPADDPEKLARLLFCYDNPPGTQSISGSQDAIGLVFPGLARSWYEGEYWPRSIQHVLDPLALSFVEQALYLRPLGPRVASFDVLADTCIDARRAQALADAADACWDAIRRQDLPAFGAAVRAGFEAQIAMLNEPLRGDAEALRASRPAAPSTSLSPHMVTPDILRAIDEYREHSLSWKLSEAGAGGYLILVSAEPIEHAGRVTVRTALS
ncbi:MAG: hypothetical protein AB1505_34485 [Candidatus Latescibacterota bacterium]